MHVEVIFILCIVIKAWEHEWWTLDLRIHWNDFAFIGDEAVTAHADSV